jgi:hypothetical protein
MHVTLDTNVFGPLVSPVDYPNHPAATELAIIAEAIVRGAVRASISEASLTLEALERHVRIDAFFRQWASKSSSINLPRPAPVRATIFERAFEMHLTVLHVPRIALGPFVTVPTAAWAADERHSPSQRQLRASQLIRDHPAAGPQTIKALGAELVVLHGVDTTGVFQFPGWPPPQELLWLKGIVAEYDRPSKFPTEERFSRHLRHLVAEWTDIDVMASHYGYGLDSLCTLDTARNTGTKGILSPVNFPRLKNQYGIEVASPGELVKRLAKSG